MAYRLATRLLEFFEGEARGHLRSIIKYNDGEFDVVYLRDDVAGAFEDGEIAEGVSESIMDSIGASIYENVFPDEHGDLLCLVQFYENVIEMNFVLDDGVGAAVAIDGEAMAVTSELVVGAQQIVVEERR